MSKLIGVKLNNLATQMILSFVALVILTAAAAGLPAYLLIRDQLDQQAWVQVEQAERAAAALYAAKQVELVNLATLTAQRPTLQQLLVGDDRPALEAYLHTLKAGAGLDILLVCNQDQHIIAQDGEVGPENLCAADLHEGFYPITAGNSLQVWLFASHSIPTSNQAQPGVVMAGIVLNDAFASQIATQTSLEHAVLFEGQTLASSLTRPTDNVIQEKRGILELDGRRFYFARFDLEKATIQAEVALEVTDIIGTQRRLLWTLAGSILVIVAVASVFGVLLARRIGRPLEKLAQGAGALSAGDFATPLKVETKVQEVALLAQALESTRTELQATLSELRQEKAWTDHLLEAIVEGIVTLDSNGMITFFSHGAERITGRMRSSALGRHCDQVFIPTEADRTFSQLFSAPNQRHKIPVKFQDGRELVLSVTGAPLLPAGQDDAEVALVFRDVSEEEAVHRLMAHFLANIAHEFRTPLSALAASVELLLDEASDLSPAELAELLNALHLGVLGLQRLVDNLLESASIEAGRFRVFPRSANLNEILAEAIRMMQPLLDKRQQSLTVELPAAMPVVRADPRRTVQVLVNLLSNANKYAPDASEIAIGASAASQQVTVTVADQGPGIPPEHRNQLFRRFTRVGSGNDRAQYGVGLGLFVVKAIVEAHGGQAGVRDQPGGGAEFWFTLPVVGE